MLKKFILIYVLFISIHAFGQDTLPPPAQEPPPDTAVAAPPVIRIPKKPLIRRKDTTAVADTFQSVRTLLKFTGISFDTMVLTQHPYFSFTNPVRYSVSVKQWTGKETIFYSMIALLLFFALIRNGFRKYIQDLLKIFLRTSVNQRQIKEQLLQSPLPSLLLNIFFLLSAGMFIPLILGFFQIAEGYNFWMLFVYSMLGLLIIYTLKFISLKILGWIFQVREVVDSYIFIVFTTNKVLGMALLPFLVVLAFTYGFIHEAAMNLSILFIVVLFAYRYFLSYTSIHRLIKISFFHFLLYLFAFEIVPLLLINKLLFRLLGETY
ncbi:MAG: DUF4271 domain-containing protein [Flavisolibacter sp.]|jgi:hypothetical protein